VAAHIGEPNWPWFRDQEAEHTAAAGEVPDCRAGLLVDSQGDETLELGALGVQDPERRVARATQLAGGTQESLQHAFEVELGDEGPTDLDQLPQVLLVESKPVSSRDAAHTRKRKSAIIALMSRLSTAMLLAAERAVDLGAELVRRGRAHYGAMIAKGDRDYATAVDVEVERVIRGVLSEAAPDIAFLGEEEGLAPADTDAIWVLDPIDGTINFSKASPLCGISLALLEAGRPTLGIVDLPLLGERYVAREGMGTFLGARRITVSKVSGLEEAMIGFADFAVGTGSAGENAFHLEVMRRLALRSLRIRVHGSACLDLAWLSAGRLNATLMLSNLPWDVSAGVLLVQEAGGVVYDLDGSPYASGSTFTIASEPELKAPLLAIVQEALAERAA
jgi:myo-inositol-1(or 4)-monophosphatase